MRIKILLYPNRDRELIAVRFHPALDFNGIAQEVVKSYVRGEKYQFNIPHTDNYIRRSLMCYINFDDIDDKDVIDYLEKINTTQTAFVRNVMLNNLFFENCDVYTNKQLNKAIELYKVEKDMKRSKNRLQRRIKSNE